MKDNLYLIGNAHLDPVWLWTREEGYAEVLSTFRAAAERIREYKEFIFTSSSAVYYKWVEEADPELFSEIKKYIEEGRWSIVGGEWVQADCNLPSGESICRQFLYAQRYFLSKFGKIATTGYNVDSFGHSGNMPQILAGSGIKNYVFSRPANFENDSPNLFRWRAKDGSEVFAYRIPFGYASNSLEDLKKKIGKCGALSEKNKRAEMVFYGVGNHGGGPTIDMLDYIEEKREKERLIYAAPDDFFRTLCKEEYPVYENELERHAVGCYSANGKIKKLNRKCELALENTEKMIFMAKSLSVPTEYKKRMDEMWQTLLFDQFHDIICGCAIRLAENYAEAELSGILAECFNIQSFLAQKIALRLDTTKGMRPVEAAKNLGRPVVIFNMNTWEVTADVVLKNFYTQRDKNFKKVVAVSDSGEVAPVQPVKGHCVFWYLRDAYFRVKVPALGYTLCYVKEGETENKDELKVYREADLLSDRSCVSVCGDYILENRYLKIRIGSENGLIKSMSDKRTGRELLSGNGAKCLVFDDTELDTWGHGAAKSDLERNFDLETWSACREKMGELCGAFMKTECKIVEEGPVRVSVQCKYTYGRSELKQTFSLNADAAELIVKAAFRSEDPHKAFKISIPVNIKDYSCYTETPYGYTERKADGKENFGHGWAAVCNEEEGLAVINDSKYSYSFDGNEMQFVIARTAIYADHCGIREFGYDYDYLDMDEQEFLYAIRPTRKNSFAELSKEVAEIVYPCHVLREGYHSGRGADRMGLIRSEGKDILWKVIKEGEDSECVLRGVNLSGEKRTSVVLLCGERIESKFGPYEIKTLKRGPDGWKETNILELE